ncbi:peptidase MA family metallohydrolase [Alkaliphilus peptidifermentans]|uniref:Peptidase MA-like domain-containing protein n=1 Tax=Alkaliphilus peptidifermentans DSM 18978 TaxID=1120976 RepID=A0A1G5HD75_9FIRM|nr:hypothetical protein [Alkaliphilus peptidifermentans]SCY61716.1 hypothetical protein SAMN03080606_01967 [Alkaliphilus peptidifermentans DSM 18978]
MRGFKDNKWKLFAVGVFVLLILNTHLSIKPVAGLYRPALRLVEYQIVSYYIRDYETIETDNYIIRHPGYDEDLLSFIIDTAEDKYKAATEVFNHNPREKVRMVIYDDLDQMMAATMLNKGNPPMGVYYGNTIHISNPLIWFNEAEYRERYYDEGPILHELVHLLTDRLAKGNFPIWFTEGVSLYFEYEIDGYKWGEELTDEEIDFTIDELTYDFHRLNQYKAYTKSFRLVKSYVQLQGVEDLIQLINDLGQGTQIKEYHYLFTQ